MKNQHFSRRLKAAAWMVVAAGLVTACAGGPRAGEAITDSRHGASAESPMPERPAVSRDSAVSSASGTDAESDGHGAPAHDHGHAHDHHALPAGTGSAPSRVEPPVRGGGRTGSAGAAHHLHQPAPPSGVSETSIGADGSLIVPRPEWTELSATAREQIARVERAVAHLDTPAKARAAAFRPALGMIPTMGVHWVNAGRMSAPVELEKPAHLMFSRIDGEDRLVGVAYAFMGRSAAEGPDLFDGRHDVWHDHPEFAPQGQALVMLHVWFVPSPHGPFAGHNPWLAFWAAGLQPPPAEALASAASARRVHQLALALAEHAEPMQFAQYLQLDSATRTDIDQRRSAIGAAIPRLAAARQRGDHASWNREGDAAIAQWRGVRDSYLRAVPDDRARELLAQLYREMEVGGHH